MLGTIVTTLQLLYLCRAITVQRRQKTEAANYNMHANQAIFWIISPFCSTSGGSICSEVQRSAVANMLTSSSLLFTVRLPSLSWTPVIHSMLLAIAFPMLLHVYREGGLNTTGRYGIVMMHNVPQIYAANAHIILDVLDGIIRVFAITIGTFDAILIVPKAFLRGIRLARLHVQNSVTASERFSVKHFPTPSVRENARCMKPLYPDSSAVGVGPTTPATGQASAGAARGPAQSTGAHTSGTTVDV